MKSLIVLTSILLSLNIFATNDYCMEFLEVREVLRDGQLRDSWSATFPYEDIVDDLYFIGTYYSFERLIDDIAETQKWDCHFLEKVNEKVTDVVAFDVFDINGGERGFNLTVQCKSVQAVAFGPQGEEIYETKNLEVKGTFIKPYFAYGMSYRSAGRGDRQCIVRSLEHKMVGEVGIVSR